MALGATIRTFAIELSDMERDVYASLELKVAQHPSENEAYLVARMLALCFEYQEGIRFTDGLYATDEPAVEVRDLTGQRTVWVGVGTPEPERLHKASKATDRVAVYCHKDPAAWLRGLQSASIHQKNQLALYQLPPTAVQALADRLARRNTWSVSRMEGEVFLQTDNDSVPFEVLPLPPH